MASEPWWTWWWDFTLMSPATMTYRSIKRWRRGSFLTVYRYEGMEGDVQWWFYGPFNLAIGFGRG